MSITVQKIGRRHYLRGNTYPVKDSLRTAGCKWDPAEKAWWTGKADVAARFEGAAPKSSGNSPSALSRSDNVSGKATYKGKEYWLLWSGMTRRGTEAAKLAFKDGSKTFWADLAEVSIVKTYDDMTFGWLDDLRKEWAKKSPQEREEESARSELIRDCGGVCRCSRPIDEGDGECMLCGYAIC